MENFEEKYEELKIEGKRRRERETLYKEPEKQMYYMGNESKARERQPPCWFAICDESGGVITSLGLELSGDCRRTRHK